MNELGVTLGKYNNSMNFVFGLTALPRDEQGNFLLDIQNNPYVEYLGYEIFGGASVPRFRHKYELEPCSEEIMSRFM